MSENGALSDFHSLYIKLFLSISLAFAIAFYIFKNINKKILYDIEQIRLYLEKISNKKYNAVVKVKHFYEFLHISLMLKNIVKKLHSKDKHKKKYMEKLKLLEEQSIENNQEI